MGTAGEPYVPALAYRWLTPFYDGVVRYTTRERRFKSALLRQARISGQQRVLDLGCGTGTLAIEAKRGAPGSEVVGLDGDGEILARARAKAARAGVAVRFDEALADALPYAAASFDRVLSSLFFHHLSPAARQRAFAGIVRVLKPGGELHVADWGAAANPLMRAAFYGIQLLDGFANTADNVQGRLPEYMRAAGLIEVRETRRFATVWGTLSLYRAGRP